jgi:transposase
VGSHRDCTWILGLPGFRVEQVQGDAATAASRMRIRIERRGPRRYPCSGCGRRTSRVRSARDRTWDDRPWAAHPVTLVYRQRRVVCRRCGIRTERIEFADPNARVTRRLRQQIGLDCQSMPTRHAAVRHGVSWGKARRAEKAFLAEWDRTRPTRRPRHLGVAEIQRGKGQRFWTVRPDLVRGDVIGLQKDRSEDSLRTLLPDRLDARQRATVAAVCTDVHRPYVNVVDEVLPHAEIVFDKCHVLQHASAAVDEVRRQAFFRGGADHARAWPREGVDAVAALAHRAPVRARCAPAALRGESALVQYLLREPLDRLWTSKTRPGVLKFLTGWFRVLRWQRLPEMERLGDFLLEPIDGIAASCDHHVHFGVVDAINTTIKAVLRRARGMPDEQMLLLKLKWATAHPIRSARDLTRLLSVLALYSNR